MTTFDALLTEWMNTPITLLENPRLPGRLFGDDSGYRNMRTIKTNSSAFATPDILARPDYEGVNAYTGEKDRRILPGGLKNGAFVLREAAARSVTLADETLQKLSGGEFQFVGLDAYRSGLRQQAGYSEQLFAQMRLVDLTIEDVNAFRRVAEFIICSLRADGVFSWVKMAQDECYRDLVKELLEIQVFSDQITEFCRVQGMSQDDAVYEYCIACRNAGIGFAAQRGNLVSENNAHAGGGACDLMIAKSGKINSITPLDYPGPFSAYDFLERDENYNLYLAALATDTVLQEHLWLCGYNFEAFTYQDWEELRRLKRIQFCLGRACKWTFYSVGSHGGEHWHEEPGNRVYDPITGEIVWEEAATAAQYPDRGNPGHSLQLFGTEDIAVWGGASALEVVEKQYGFE